MTELTNQIGEQEYGEKTKDFVFATTFYMTDIVIMVYMKYFFKVYKSHEKVNIFILQIKKMKHKKFGNLPKGRILVSTKVKLYIWQLNHNCIFHLEIGNGYTQTYH
jgi:hypothetical protein